MTEHNIASRNRRNSRMPLNFWALPAGCLLFVILAVVPSVCPAPIPIVRSEELPIPHGTYKSWALFLICNPTWMTPESAPEVKRLYYRFEAFGTAIGPQSVAVWFLRGPGNDASSVDFNRSALFCLSLKLPPSQSPYVLFTTAFPGDGLPNQFPNGFPTSLGDHLLLSLNGKSASEITEILGELTDKIVTSDLNAKEFRSKDYWSTMEKIYLAARDSLGSLAAGVSVTIDTGVLKTEVKFDKP